MMRCLCGEKAGVAHTEVFERPGRHPLVRRRRFCQGCGASFFTAEVPVQEVLPDHRADVLPARTREAPRLPRIGPRIRAGAPLAARTAEADRRAAEPLPGCYPWGRRATRAAAGPAGSRPASGSPRRSAPPA